MDSRSARGVVRIVTVLDALPDALVFVDRNGLVVNANISALGMFETPGAALFGLRLVDLLSDCDLLSNPGSTRCAEAADHRGACARPTRMTARRTDGTEFPVEVSCARLEDGRETYDVYGAGVGDELAMIVVRDLTGTLDTEAQLIRSQRQTEMILRAADEGFVGTDVEGRVVLANPAAAHILGYRASELGGHELHPLVLHSHADGRPFPYAESALADTLRSGREHRLRGQALWAKNGERVPVDLTTAAVHDGHQLVGAVMTFTDRRPYEQLAEQYAAEVADQAEWHAAELEREQERYAALATRCEQLKAALGGSASRSLEGRITGVGALDGDVRDYERPTAVGESVNTRSAALDAVGVLAFPNGADHDLNPAPRRPAAQVRGDLAQSYPLAPIAGSWIIGAAVSARRSRQVAEQAEGPAPVHLSNRPALAHISLRPGTTGDALQPARSHEAAHPRDPRAEAGSDGQNPSFPTRRRQRSWGTWASAGMQESSRHDGAEVPSRSPGGSSEPHETHRADDEARNSVANLLARIRSRPN
ncbi:PAS domain-containing protein [Streptomyces sp. NPDC086771]|uniref:PAS domain-containing protein n=1 Tax=unclassified Streptomyces TaxID=2593676 RepID=UPI0038048ED5